MAEIEGIEKVNQALSEIPKKLERKIISILNVRSRDLQTYVRTEHLTGGTTDTRLRTRSGRLRAGTRPIKAEKKGDSIEAGISIGTNYAGPHFGPDGQETTIRPKRGKYLTIPLKAAMTPSGVSRGSAMYGPWGETFIARSRAGNLIIFGKKKSYQSVKIGKQKVKGVSIIKMGQEAVPLFLLKQQVTIPARVHPVDILDWIAPKIRNDFVNMGMKA